MKNINAFIKEKNEETEQLNNQHETQENITEKKTGEASKVISMEIYRDGKGNYGVYFGEDGGSGINATGRTPEEAVEEAKEYMLDMFDEL